MVEMLIREICWFTFDCWVLILLRGMIHDSGVTYRYTISDTGSIMSRLMGKPTICICENKDADQLRGNHEADQRLCFRYTDSTISLLPKSEISSF